IPSAFRRFSTAIRPSMWHQTRVSLRAVSRYPRAKVSSRSGPEYPSERTTFAVGLISTAMCQCTKSLARQPAPPGGNHRPPVLKIEGLTRSRQEFPMSTTTVLRQRMIEDMSLRNLAPRPQEAYIRGCKKLAAFLRRSPDTATAEDIRLFQLHLAEQGVSICTRNRTMTGVAFL